MPGQKHQNPPELLEGFFVFATTYFPFQCAPKTFPAHTPDRLTLFSNISLEQRLDPVRQPPLTGESWTERSNIPKKLTILPVDTARFRVITCPQSRLKWLQRDFFLVSEQKVSFHESNSTGFRLRGYGRN